jgi:sterol desaturase/sphingolipid hydroxylase (fatty acid hydroxylase superfamily)
VNAVDWLIAWKAWIIVSLFAVLFITERLLPFAPAIRSLPRIGRNLGLAMFNAIASPLIVIPLTAFAAGSAPQWRPDAWSGWAGAGVDLLILDCWIYFWHRLNHRVPFLWRWHEVHHLDETLDSTSALRFHVGEVVMSSVVRAAVIWLVGIPLQTVIIFEILVTAAALFQHSNVAVPPKIERFLSLMIVTPSIHWVHHHTRRSDIESNYANILSAWDRVFGSASLTVRTPGMPVGIEDTRDLSLSDLIARPFQITDDTNERDLPS